ncbi:MAG: T9SS type A sorting domain-containing protein [Bacteroidota bacterium]|nr:T9SS type A sorting domain-containing protein [Bacteroidota bacterium]
MKHKASSFLIGLLLEFLFISSSYSQTKLTLPTTADIYQDSYILPDGTIRVIANEYKTYQGLYYMDRIPDGTFSEVVYLPQHVNDVYFNWAGVEAKVTPLANGDAIIGINQIACDYPPPSGICIINGNGEVQWGIDLDQEDYYYPIDRIVQVDSSAFAVILLMSDTFFINISGHIIPKESHFEIYNRVLSHSMGVYAYADTSLFSLNTGFEKLDSVQLDASILSINFYRSDTIVVTTEKSVYVLNNDLSTLSQSEIFTEMELTTMTTNYIWLAKKKGHQIFRTSVSFELIDTFEVHPDFFIHNLIGSDSLVTVTGSYNGPKGFISFFHTTAEEYFELQPVKDLRIDGISVPGNVLYLDEPFSFDGITLGYNNVEIDVTNIGLGIIQSLIIQYTEGTGCGMCESWMESWAFDSLDLSPGESIKLSLGSFSPWCVQIDVNELCMYVHPADNLPEINSGNNSYCADVTAFIVGVDEVRPSIFQITHNPAATSTTLSVDVISGKYFMRVLAMDGREIFEQSITQLSTEIDVNGWPSGLYSLILTGEDNFVEVIKLVVQH